MDLFRTTSVETIGQDADGEGETDGVGRLRGRPGAHDPEAAPDPAATPR